MNKKEFWPKNVSFRFMIVAVGLSFFYVRFEMIRRLVSGDYHVDARCGTEELVKT